MKTFKIMNNITIVNSSIGQSDEANDENANDEIEGLKRKSRA